MTTETQDPHRLDTEAALDALYGAPVPMALAKEVDHLAEPYRRMIEASPFMALATAGPEGLDCTPRGDPVGSFVRVEDARTLAIPDRRGNNRIDSLRNIVRDPRVALLFLIPGRGETLRVNGRAEIRVDPELLASFTHQGKQPRSVIRVRVEAVYFQCQKALARSGLWTPESWPDISALPTTGAMAKSVTAGTALGDAFDADAYDAEYPRRMKETIY